MFGFECNGVLRLAPRSMQLTRLLSLAGQIAAVTDSERDGMLDVAPRSMQIGGVD